MAGIKLSYFDARGLAEPTRWILSHAGVDFEDIRAPLDSIPAVLPQEIKEKCRWGQVPLAEFDGKRLSQSLAITRYFARKYDLVPTDLYEAALCDEYVDSMREFLSAWYAVNSEKDEEKKQEKRQEVLKTTKERYLKIFESIVKENGGSNLVGTSMTWADIYLAHTINHVELCHGVQLLDDLPGIKTVCENVVSSPGIKVWLTKRPQTKF